MMHTLSPSSDNVTQTPSSNDVYARGTVEGVLFSVLLIILILASVIGNVAVIIASMSSQHLKSQLSTTFIINLAITDLSNSIMVMLPSAISVILGLWPFGSWACRLQCAANYLLIIVSMLTLAAVSIDRYHAVINPLLYGQVITKNIVYCMIAWTWTQGVVFALVPVGLDWVHYDYFEVVCAIDWFTAKNAVIYVIVAFIMCFSIPGFILVYAYAKIIHVIRSKINQIGSNGLNNEDKRMQKTLRSLIVIVTIFYICMTPFCVTKLLKVVTGNEYFVPGVINTLASLIQYLASATNPLVYGIFRKEFRQAFHRQLRRLTCKNPMATTDNVIAGATAGQSAGSHENGAFRSDSRIGKSPIDSPSS